MADTSRLATLVQRPRANPGRTSTRIYHGGAAPKPPHPAGYATPQYKEPSNEHLHKCLGLDT